MNFERLAAEMVLALAMATSPCASCKLVSERLSTDMTDMTARPVRQCQRPSGWLGRFVLWRMNASHSKLTDWALAHVTVENHDTILDVGCGGGRTVSKLAQAATQGKV